MSRIYLASSWRNPLQPQAVKMLRDAGHEVYDFRNPTPDNCGFSWAEIDPDWRNWTPEQFIKGLTHPLAQRGYSLDKEGLDWADTCVLLLPCGKSAHLEAGYAIGQGKPTLIVLHTDLFEPELMYLLTGSTVRVVLDLSHLVESLELEAEHNRIHTIDEVLRLRAENERLERETDWIAEHLATRCQYNSDGICERATCPVDYEGNCECVTIPDWRAAARKAVEKSPCPKN